jgi:hypothetical protein
MNVSECYVQTMTMNDNKDEHYSSEILTLAAQKARLAGLNKVPGRLQALVAEKSAKKK